MQLLESMVAAAIMAASGAASLQLWAGLCQSTVEETRNQGGADQLEAELTAIEASLQQLALSRGALAPCGQAAPALLEKLQARPPATTVHRDLSLLLDEDALQVELSSEGKALSRRRVYNPAALGLCTPASSLPTDPSPEAHG
ncbi:MAG: hypothetical protein WCF98_11155 [Synechococcus sp. ELA057]